MNEITQDRVRELFDYKDGELYWREYRSSAAQKGDRSGSGNTDGYRRVMVDGKVYTSHWVIFLYHHGYLPKQLDHIDGNKSNNDILNLREATNQENHQNVKKQKSYGGKQTSSKYKGVSRDIRREMWRVHIQINGKSKHLGRFESEIEAAKAYNSAAVKYFGEFAKPNVIS